MSSEDKASLVPKLRFPEFRKASEWRFVELDELAVRCKQRNRGESIDRVLTNSAEFGVLDQRDYFEKDIATQGKLDSYFVVEPGDYVYNPRISTAAPVGPISRNNSGTGVMSPLYTVFRFTDPKNDFYQHYFKTTAWHGYLRQASSTGARHDRMAIGNDAFMAMPLPAPSPREQRRVADCLNSLDELIAAQARKVDALKAHKTALMQRLFPCLGESQPRLRFSAIQNAGPWAAQPFAELFEVKHGHAFEGEFFSNEGEYVLLTPGNFCEEGAYRGRGKNQKYYTGEIPADYVLKRGDLLVAMTEQAAGLLGSPVLVPESDKFLHNQRLGLLKKKPGAVCTNEFLFHVFNTQFVRAAIHDSASGTKVRHTSPTKIGDIVFSVPTSLAEQARIAECLTSLDRLITLAVKEQDALKTHKAGLMQQLFPSAEVPDA